MLRYTESLEGVTAAMLTGGFFDGWPDPPSPVRHLALLRGSDHVVLAIDDVSGQVAGFVTAISDGVLAAYIPLLEVLPAWRGQGAGSELVRRLLARIGHLYMVDVVCDPDVQPFYARLGFQPGGAMLRRNRAALRTG